MRRTYIYKPRLNTVSYLVLLPFVMLMGCKKFVEIPPPVTQLVTASVFDNSTTATSAQTSIYTQMVSSSGRDSYWLSVYSGLLADELTNYSTSINFVDYYTNAMNAATGNMFGRWSFYYNYIYQANAVISALQGNSSISPAIEQQLIGEAEFVRAFWLFYLTNCYGNVPIVTSTNYTVNATIARSPQVQVYQQIISDLTDAQQKLNNNYIDDSDTTTTTERTRPNKAVAESFLARVYLYMGRYDSATYYSGLVINNNQYQLCHDLSLLMNPNSSNYVFMANSTEAIWQLAIPLPSSANTQDALRFILLGAPSTGEVNCTTISPQLLGAFETGDLRRKYWIDSVNPTAPYYYYPFKYQNISNNVTEYDMVFRLAEQYLIRAEAEAQLNDLIDAASDLNVIRNRAGLPNISNSIASSQTSLFAAILHERQVELFTEWGHRWFDLIRTGNVNSVMGSPGNVCNAKGGTWNSYDTLFPIPPSDIMLDHNLSQNAGY
jgi:hypothetical protein